ncbi:MAG: VPLPA-CTERM sorting domain-containing protein [Zoogloea sp.]|nr:VPLPA-CTERM sorting domain-containing protein [Zoogloea sp.]
MNKHLQKWFACLALLLLPMAASAGLKFKDCVLDGHILFKEYLVAGSAATPFNEFRMFTQESTCGLDVWDLTLNETQQVSSSNGVSVFSTVYDGGFAGLLNAPVNYALWSVSGTGTTTVDTTNHSVNTVMDLVGVSITDPSMVERLILGFNLAYSSTPTGNECFEWVSQPCTSYDYLGGDLAYGPASSHAGALRVEVVPEPASGLLLATGLAGLAALRHRRKLR